jgi:hypothetical protein
MCSVSREPSPDYSFDDFEQIAGHVKLAKD